MNNQKANNKQLLFMDGIKSIIRKNMKKKNISSTEARKSLGIKRYEKSLK
jgi:hypothetical protein